MVARSDADREPFVIKRDLTGRVIGVRVSGPGGGQLFGTVQQTNTGASYLVAGSNIIISSSSNGQVTISSTASGSGGGTGADPFASYVVISLTSSLSNERNLSAGLGLSLTDNGAGASVVLAINNSVVATLSGSRFHGSIETTGTGSFDLGISGSLTRLTDGTSYLVAGSGITILSSSNGQVTISSTTQTPSDSVFATLSGSRFHGNLEVVGTASFDSGLSGSLTRLTDGTSFLAAGKGILITSASNGQVVVAGNDSVFATLSGSKFSGNLEVVGSASFDSGLSGSLTRLTDGTSFIIAGANITVTSASNGAITVTAATSSFSQFVELAPDTNAVSGTTETVVGSMRITSGTYAVSHAMLGNVGANDTATLRLRQFNQSAGTGQGNIILVLTGAGNLSDVPSTGSVVLPLTAFYDMTLACSSVSGTAIFLGGTLGI